ncbi:DUF5357 family protein [Oscillatoriales cyanobacterium LEGE 11467]|uniref:DUF5357 family protein n=1 Tax=Zarconia navalis LEGE 11467 TaxID=1828826 RepID=A0A928W2B5_9CYAN|nr:DUF5357 domain-containing protein [Zarconia navalis]MBE9042706.1 DUF5357 family protein [Zarconia navalis LEGE 11467]
MATPVEWFNKNLKPKKLFSWQTLILVSLVLWLFLAIVYLSELYYPTEALQLENEDRDAFIRSSLLLLSVGLAWWQIENPIRIGNFSLRPWILSALACLLFFPSLLTGEIPAFAWIIWPILAAGIAIFPKVRRGKDKWQVPPLEERSQLLMLGLSSLILSSWLGFAFLVEHWTQDYPELASADVSRSNFVVRVGNAPNTDGKEILDQTVSQIAGEVNGQTWGSIERFLFNLQLGRVNIQEQVMNQLQGIVDRDRWSVQVEIVPETEYDVRIFARKTATSAGRSDYLLSKTCQIRPDTRMPMDSPAYPAGMLNCKSTQFTFE